MVKGINHSIFVLLLCDVKAVGEQAGRVENKRVSLNKDSEFQFSSSNMNQTAAKCDMKRERLRDVGMYNKKTSKRILPHHQSHISMCEGKNHGRDFIKTQIISRSNPNEKVNDDAATLEYFQIGKQR
jgi:hypothetical protein